MKNETRRILMDGTPVSDKETAHASERLKRIRDFLGFTQREMAQELGVVHGAVGLWESGQRSIPGPVLVLMDLYEKELGIGESKGRAEDLTRLEKSWFTRGLKVSSLGAEYAARYLWSHLRGLFDKRGVSAIQLRTHQALSLKIADSFGKLKGLPMKLGADGQLHEFSGAGFAHTRLRIVANRHQAAQIIRHCRHHRPGIGPNTRPGVSQVVAAAVCRGKSGPGPSR